MKRGRLAIFVLALGPVACSLFVDTRELAGAPTPAVAADAADSSATVHDSSVDAAPSLDATGGDGPIAVRFCENPIYSGLFCADFDGTDPFEKFSIKDELGGTLSVTSSLDGGAAGLSLPNALHAEVSMRDGGGDSVALVSHLLQSADQDLSLSFGVRFGPLVEVLPLVMTIGSSQIAMLVTPDGFTLQQVDPADGGVLSEVGVLHSPSPNWIHLRFDVRAKGPEPSLTFYVDGVKKVDRKPIVGGQAGLGTLGFTLGALATTPASADYDNVLFDVKPLP